MFLGESCGCAILFWCDHIRPILTLMPKFYILYLSFLPQIIAILVTMDDYKSSNDLQRQIFSSIHETLKLVK